MTKETEVAEIAERIAEAVIEKFFLTLGINAKDPQSILTLQKDLSHLRAWRESTEALKEHGMKAVITTLVAGALGWLGAHFYLK